MNNSNNPRRNFLSMATVVLAVAMTLTACAPPAAAPAAKPAEAAKATEAPAAASESGGKTVTFWSRDGFQQIVNPVIEAWNKAHKDQIKPTFIPGDQFVQKFSTALAGGDVPDLVAVDLIYVPAYSAAGQMTDITDLAKSLPFFDKLSPSHVRLGSYDGKVYALPFNAEGSVLIYNKNLFKKAGLDPEKPPTTWDEMYQAAKKVTALGDGNYGFYFSGACAGCNAFTFLPYIWASGGDVISEDGKSATVASSKPVKDALEFYKKMWDEKLIPESAKADNGSDFFNTFTSGKIGMVGTGAFGIAAMKKDHPDIEFGISPLPGKDGKSSSFAGGDCIGIPKGSKNVKEAFEFLTFFLNEDVQVENLAKAGGLPLRLDLVDNKYSKADPRYITVANAMFKEGRTPYLLPYNQIFNDGNGPWLAMIQKAVFDGKVDEAIADGQEAFTKILTSK